MWNITIWKKCFLKFADFSAAIITHDPLGIILICWCGAQTFIIINIENSW